MAAVKSELPSAPDSVTGPRAGETDFGRDDPWRGDQSLGGKANASESESASRPNGLDTVERRAGRSTEPGAAAALDAEGAPLAVLGPSTPERLYGAFAVARLLLALLLLIMPVILGLWSLASTQPFYVGLSLLYFLATLLALRTPRHAGSVLTAAGQLRRRWLAATVGVDLLCFALLLRLLGGGLNVSALFAMPVLMAGTLAGPRVAFAMAAAATLVLLGLGLVGWEAADAAVSLMQTGLTGAGLFALAGLTTELVSRLAREERSARSSLAMARQQALLNRLVIEEMEDGILAVDREGRVRIANPAALALMGAPREDRLRMFSLHDRVAWQPLLAAVEQAFQSGSWPDGGRDILLAQSGAQAAPGRPAAAAAGGPARAEDRPLRVRMRFTRRRQQELGESLCVLFMEDLRTLRLRARQDKLAAMGRVSAGIAHEIRNPLAAIAQANALLGEELTEPAQQRLSRMVNDNVDRLRRIVDDVLVAAPGGADLTPPVIDLCSHVRQLVLDWRQTNGEASGAAPRVVLELPGPRDLLDLRKLHNLHNLHNLHAPQENFADVLAGAQSGALSGPGPNAATPVVAVRIEPDHLGRVLVNLLDNAFQHSQKLPGSIKVSVSVHARSRAGETPDPSRLVARRRSAGRVATLSVASDGAPIPPEVEALLFEPFFSTRSRGSGLGLYICRELCERHGVSIEYQHGAADQRHANVFVLQLPTVVTAPDGTTEDNRSHELSIALQSAGR